MDDYNHCSVLGYDTIERELEMRKKYKLKKLHPRLIELGGYYPPKEKGDERIVINGVPIIFDHKRQEIILNANIKEWELNNVCDYLVAEGFIDK